MKYCCIKMEGALEEYGTPISYTPYTRSYDMAYGTEFKNSETGEITFGVVEPLFYCPWCGVKLPENLFAEWHDEIEKFDIDTLDKEQLKKLPEEYLTEEWWKKKGL